MSRPRHTKKELEELLQEAERKRWEGRRGKKYFRMFCPCGAHQKTVHLSPSDPHYKQNLVGRLMRTGCWEEDTR